MPETPGAVPLVPVTPALEGEEPPAVVVAEPESPELADAGAEVADAPPEEPPVAGTVPAELPPPVLEPA